MCQSLRGFFGAESGFARERRVKIWRDRAVVFRGEFDLPLAALRVVGERGVRDALGGFEDERNLVGAGGGIAEGVGRNAGRINPSAAVLFGRRIPLDEDRGLIVGLAVGPGLARDDAQAEVLVIHDPRGGQVVDGGIIAKGSFGNPVTGQVVEERGLRRGLLRAGCGGDEKQCKPG